MIVLSLLLIMVCKVLTFVSLSFSLLARKCNQRNVLSGSQAVVSIVLERELKNENEPVSLVAEEVPNCKQDIYIYIAGFFSTFMTTLFYVNLCVGFC